jgi:hypothetical protein
VNSGKIELAMSAVVITSPANRRLAHGASKKKTTHVPDCPGGCGCHFYFYFIALEAAGFVGADSAVCNKQ